MIHFEQIREQMKEQYEKDSSRFFVEVTGQTLEVLTKHTKCVNLMFMRRSLLASVRKNYRKKIWIGTELRMYSARPTVYS